MTSEAQDLRRSRGGFKSQVTRTDHLFERHVGKPLEEYGLAAAERAITSLTRADQGFADTHASLIDAGANSSDYDEQDEYQTLFDRAWGRVQYVAACARARDKGTLIRLSVQALKANSADGYDASLADEYAEIAQGLKELIGLLSVHGTSSHPELMAMQDLLLREWGELRKKRGEAGYEPPATGGGTLPEHSGTIMPKAQAISVALPQFSGKTAEFKEFKALFNAIISRQKHLSDDEKKALLMKSMASPAAKEQGRLAVKQTTKFADAMALLSRRYENCREVLATHLQAFYKMPVLQYTASDVRTALKFVADEADGVIAAKCTTAGQVMVAFMDGQFNRELRLAWRKHTAASVIPPDLDQVREFLQDQELLLASPTEENPIRSPRTPHSKPKAPRRRKNEERKEVKRERSPSPAKSISPPPCAVFQAVKPRRCSFCKEDHTTFNCPKFTKMSPQDRQAWVKEARRCFNCLGGRHLAPDCKSQNRCQECNATHHTLLHIPKWDKNSDSDSKSSTALLAREPQREAVAPITAVVQVSAGGRRHTARLMVDTGANVSLISKDLATKLKAPHHSSNAVRIGGLGSVTSPYSIKMTLHGRADMGFGDETVIVHGRVLNSLPQPDTQAPQRNLGSQPFLKGKPIADPDFGPGARIDFIVDLQTWQHCRLEGSISGPRHDIWADRSLFGWVTGGSSLDSTTEVPSPPQALIARNSAVERLITQEWEDPELPGDSSPLSLEDAGAEISFEKTCRKLEGGRYEVGMPTIEDPPVLGESRRQAVSRYRAVERSLKRKGRWQEYKDAVLDFLKRGHAEPVPTDDLNKPHSACYYMPMHAVFKTTSTSTKVRPVCDASAASSSGASYNDTLAVGPCRYHPLTSILIQFRDPPIAMTADVSKMYRQVSLRLEDRDFHRFVFELEDGHLADFRMTTVTFGVKASPYVATKVLQRIATDQEEDHPAAATALRTSFYVDDVLTGAATVQEALHLQQDLSAALDTGGMPICKWRSNNQELMDAIPPEVQDTPTLQLGASPSSQHKALGLHWATVSDDLYVATPEIKASEQVTKRQLLSTTAQIFDPLGWFSPALMVPRIMTQQAWKNKAGWDDPLDPSIRLTWQGWLREMPSISLHPIHRPLRLEDQILVQREIHGFSDASTKAFGGVVYLRSTYESGMVDVKQIIAKGKVAPIKETTVPRLELRGALVVSALLQTVGHDLSIPDDSRHGWTDSTVVLGWLHQPPAKLTVYVGNRVKRILEAGPIEWHHVPGITNPADCLSRGLRPEDLCNYSLWWEGPEWLKESESNWPPDQRNELPLPEMRAVMLTAQTPRYSVGLDQTNFRQWVRVVGWIRRYWHNLTRPQEARTTRFLTSTEYREAEQTVLRASQRRAFEDTLEAVRLHKPLSKINPLRKVTPFIDGTDELLKVGGRLQHSDLPTTAKHPTILHAGDPIVRLLLTAHHVKMLHPPRAAALASLAYSFHIIRVQQVIKSITKHCLSCQRKWAQPSQQQMGELPSVRCCKAEVFRSTGVDYAGPLFVTQGRGRGYSKVKAYVAVFVCLATKAVHLELVSDLTAQAFLAALDRFCGRRGKPSQIRSDNGSNFHGGNTELVEALKAFYEDHGEEQVARWSVGAGVEWHFSPAYSPNFGGLWEAAVRVMKGLIRESLYLLVLNQEELVTILIAAEASMNSRPYIPIYSTDEEGMCPLTPGHFLIGRPLTSIPQRVDTESKLQNVRRWQLVKRMELELWTQYQGEVISQLTSRSKQLYPNPNLKIGDAVLISNAQTRRNQWPLGLIVEVFPGPDGLVRTADVRVSTDRTASNKVPTTVYRRSTRHLVKLPIHTEEDDGHLT